MTRDTFDMFKEPERGRFGDNESAAPTRARVNGASDLVDVTMYLHAESKPGQKEQGAILVSDDRDDKKAKWLPKSQVECVRTGKRERGTGRSQYVEIVTVTMPQWLASEKGLI